MAMNYLDLIGPKSNEGSIHNFVNYRRVPVKTVLEEAQAFIYARLRVREMRVSGILTLAIGASYIALPDRFLEPIALRDREGLTIIPNVGDRDTFVEPAQLNQRRCYDSDGNLTAGVPCSVSIFDERYQFDVKAQIARTYDHVFYQSSALLSATNTTNFLTKRYPHILRIGCLAGAASFMKDDEEEQKQLAKLTGLCDAANAESDLGRAS